jgi:hypothetical protein
MNFCKNFSDHVISKILKYVNGPDAKSIFMKDLNREDKKIYLHCEKYVKSILYFYLTNLDDEKSHLFDNQNLQDLVNKIEDEISDETNDSQDHFQLLIHRLSVKIFKVIKDIYDNISDILNTPPYEDEDKEKKVVFDGTLTMYREVYHSFIHDRFFFGNNHADDYYIFSQRIERLLRNFTFYDGELRLKEFVKKSK